MESQESVRARPTIASRQDEGQGQGQARQGEGQGQGQRDGQEGGRQEAREEEVGRHPSAPGELACDDLEHVAGLVVGVLGRQDTFSNPGMPTPLGVSRESHVAEVVAASQAATGLHQWRYGLRRFEQVATMAELIEGVTLAVEARASPMGSFLSVFHRVVPTTGALEGFAPPLHRGCAISSCYGAGGTLWVS